MTIAFLSDAIAKLRAVDADTPTAHCKLDLWRGMRDMKTVEQFSRDGGTELALMSTTTKLEVAFHYLARGESSLLFKLHTDTFMSRGASIQFVSVLPAEEEILFPPLTYLKPTGKCEVVKASGRTFTVVECIPHFASA